MYFVAVDTLIMLIAFYLGFWITNVEISARHLLFSLRWEVCIPLLSPSPLTPRASLALDYLARDFLCRSVCALGETVGGAACTYPGVARHARDDWEVGSSDIGPRFIGRNHRAGVTASPLRPLLRCNLHNCVDL